MKSKEKVSRKVKKNHSQVRRTSDAGENEHLIRSGASPDNFIAIQHKLGNRAVQRLLDSQSAVTHIQTTSTPLGAHVEMREPASREKLLQQLIKGEKNITDYIQGVCYDVVAYVQYLRGLVTFDQIQQTSGQNWVPILNFTGGKLWDGQDIPIGSAVGFTRMEDASGAPAGFFHAGVGIGGTQIRAVNGNLLGAGWSVPADLAKALIKKGPGVYEYDRANIQVWYR